MTAHGLWRRTQVVRIVQASRFPALNIFEIDLVGFPDMHAS